MGAEPAPVEFLYELWDTNWDDGPLGNYKIRRHQITKKTSKRIYFTYLHDRPGFVDRRQIEADGRIWYRARQRALYLHEPELPQRPKPASLAELKQAMAAAHPDRGGTDAEFIKARARYERALNREAS